MRLNSTLFRWLTAFRISTFLLGIPSASASELIVKPHLAEDPMTIVGEMEESYEAIADYEAIFTKQARFDGKLSEEETIRFRFKKPFMVYMKWIEEPRNGQEVVYVEGKNDNRLRAHKGGLFSFVVVSLDPEGSRAMKGSHHPITDVGIGKLIELIGSEVKRATERQELKWKSLGCEEVDGRNSHKIEAAFPKERNAGYYCHRAVVWIDCEYGLPVRVKIYDWNNHLYEKFGYRELRVNVGIPDERFEL